MSIERLPGVRLTAETVLAQLLEKKDRIKSVAICIVWDDDSMDVDWSMQTATELAVGGLLIQRVALDIMDSGAREPVGCSFDRFT